MKNEIRHSIKRNRNFKILLLEDNLIRVKEYKNRFKELAIKFDLVHIETTKKCLELLRQTEFDIILLDHDLGGETFVNTDREDCGSEVARQINLNKTLIKGNPLIVIHSFNSDAATYMKSLIPNSLFIPGFWLKDKFSIKTEGRK
jgi:CheY-like chemotaxis protein